jgi:two-component system, OmpR family, response regulator
MKQSSAGNDSRSESLFAVIGARAGMGTPYVPRMRVLVVEDEAKVAAFVKAGLEEHGFAVELCGDGNSAAARLESEAFDAVVLDVMLPGRDGLGVLRKLREARNAVPVIVLTARGDLHERVEGLNLGADDYLAKPFSMIELVARLGAVLRRRTGTGLTVQSFADLSMNLATREVKRGATRIELTPREFALLECLLRMPGKVVTRIEISQGVWGHQFDPGTNFVDVAIQRLRRKIDDPFPQKLIQTVRGVGYALQTDP